MFHSKKTAPGLALVGCLALFFLGPALLVWATPGITFKQFLDVLLFAAAVLGLGLFAACLAATGYRAAKAAALAGGSAVSGLRGAYGHVLRGLGDLCFRP